MLRINKQDLSLNKMIFICVLMMVNWISEVKSVEYYDKKPDYVASCKLGQSDFDKCTTVELQKLFDQMAIDSIPEIVEAFGPIDPMRLRDMNYEQNEHDIGKLHANFSQLTVQGFSKSIVRENRMNRTDLNWMTKLFLPKIRLEGMYKMEGRILMLPVNGSGKMFIEIENLNITFLSKTRLFDKAGFTFDDLTVLRMDINMTRVRSNFENILNGQSKEVERSTNEFFNENWREFFEALKPVFTETVASALFGLLHNIIILIPGNFLIDDVPSAKEFYEE